MNYDRFSKMAARQHEDVIKVEPRRGAIYDRYMEPLGINLDTPSIYCDPRNIQEKEHTAEILSKILGVNREDLLRKLNKDKAFVWVKRKVGEDKAKKIKAAGLKGVHIITESKRNYSNDNMASHIIGFVGIDNDGLEGLELAFDDKLKGKLGWTYFLRDARRRTVLFREKESIPPQNGYNLILTIDSVIQYIAEEEIKKIARKFNVESVSVIVMEPFSGRILAMANYPDYDLNAFSKTPKNVMKNIAITNVYEPGSIFKVITASAALEEGVVDLDDKYDCENGEYRVGGRILHDYHPYGELSFIDVIAMSSNIGTVKVAQELGEEKVYEYIKKFGFGKTTGIDLSGEVAGISRHPSIWSRSDITTIPIGQGIAVTTVQMARAISVIANGGYVVTPYVVDRMTTWEGGLYREFTPPSGERVLSEETCDKMKKILRKVVTDGTGRRVDSKVYELCGKTGTAQMVDPEGGYFENKYNASFMGFAPEKDPVISIVVTANDPHPVHFGSSVAGPAFKGIAERTLQYLGSNPASKTERVLPEDAV